MTRTAIALAACLTMIAAPQAMAEEKPMGWFATTMRSFVAFHACTTQFKRQFIIDPKADMDISHINADEPKSDGVWHVRFEATATDKDTGRRRHFAGVCHYGREGETRIEARMTGQDFGKQVKVNAPVRRVG
ncbi:MAG: hypothetical protein J7521_13865 [Caulobacter sp.]|nr:hypothetical protein [Caulobacter sp.]